MRRTGKDTYFADYTLPFARSLRKEMTGVEKLIWQYLRNKNCSGVHFRRQVPVGQFIADFLSYDPRLIIELDGSQHADNSHYDAVRDRSLQQEGFYVLRFWNHDVIENLEGVYNTIEETIASLRKQNE